MKDGPSLCKHKCFVSDVLSFQVLVLVVMHDLCMSGILCMIAGECIDLFPRCLTDAFMYPCRR